MHQNAWRLQIYQFCIIKLVCHSNRASQFAPFFERMVQQSKHRLQYLAHLCGELQFEHLMHFSHLYAQPCHYNTSFCGWCCGDSVDSLIQEMSAYFKELSVTKERDNCYAGIVWLAQIQRYMIFLFIMCRMNVLPPHWSRSRWWLWILWMEETG